MPKKDDDMTLPWDTETNKAVREIEKAPPKSEGRRRSRSSESYKWLDNGDGVLRSDDLSDLGM